MPAGHAVIIPGLLEHAESLPAGASFITLSLDPAGDQAPSSQCRTLAVSPLLLELVRHIARIGGLDAEIPDQVRLAQVLVDQLRQQAPASLSLDMPRDQRARRVAQLVQDAPGDRRSLAALSATAGATRRTIERIFQAELGISLGEWRQQARLHNSVRLLAEGQPVSAVATASGYGSASAFILAFRRRFGATPHQYRRR